MNHTSAVGWAPEPHGRGTVGLLWSCLITIFLCSWSAVHPNLPGEDENAGRILWRRVRYMMLAVTAPEYVMMLAMGQFQHARQVRAKSPLWSLQQSFFLTMGGYAVQTAEDALPVRVRSAKLVALFDDGLLAWPEGIDDDIEDRSNADALVKSITLLQTLWFVAQVVGRAAARLSVTTLELFTLGIVVCAAVTYAAWWSKPFDIRRPVVLQLHDEALLPKTSREERSQLSYPGGRPEGKQIVVMITAIVTLVFGAVHLAGWGFYFPTVVEKWLWRVGSVVCMTLPVASLLQARWIDDDGKLWWILWGPTVSAYALFRVYMFVAMFVGLREVPGDVYETVQWTQYFPSFG